MPRISSEEREIFYNNFEATLSALSIQYNVINKKALDVDSNIYICLVDGSRFVDNVDIELQQICFMPVLNSDLLAIAWFDMYNVKNMEKKGILHKVNRLNSSENLTYGRFFYSKENGLSYYANIKIKGLIHSLRDEDIASYIIELLKNYMELIKVFKK
jgi:hypothetical protein